MQKSPRWMIFGIIQIQFNLSSSRPARQCQALAGGRRGSRKVKNNSRRLDSRLHGNDINYMKKLALAQFIILTSGTIFAWFNFGGELVDWLNDRPCTTGCTTGLVNPFLTPCFYGALFFTIAFVLSIFILIRNKK